MEKYQLSETQLKYIIEESFNKGELAGRMQTSIEGARSALEATVTGLLDVFEKTKTASQS